MDTWTRGVDARRNETTESMVPTPRDDNVELAAGGAAKPMGHEHASACWNKTTKQYEVMLPSSGPEFLVSVPVKNITVQYSSDCVWPLCRYVI